MKRIKEPSTWAGIGVLALAAKGMLPPSWAWLGDAASVVCGGIAGVLSEKGKAA